MLVMLVSPVRLFESVSQTWFQKGLAAGSRFSWHCMMAPCSSAPVLKALQWTAFG